MASSGLYPLKIIPRDLLKLLCHPYPGCCLSMRSLQGDVKGPWLWLTSLSLYLGQCPLPMRLREVAAWWACPPFSVLLIPAAEQQPWAAQLG